MPSRNVVEDSDDEDGVDVQISPTKILETRSEVELNPQNDGMEYLNFGSPSPPCAVSNSEERQSTDVGSSGKLPVDVKARFVLCFASQCHSEANCGALICV